MIGRTRSGLRPGGIPGSVDEHFGTPQRAFADTGTAALMRLESDRPARILAHRVGVVGVPQTDFILWQR